MGDDGRREERAIGRFVFGLLAAVAIGIALRAHYALVFLPAHHEGWPEAARRVLDVEAWWAYLRTPVGATLHVLWVGAVAVVLLPWFAARLRGARGLSTRGRSG